MKEKQNHKDFSAYFHHRDCITRFPVIYYNMQMRFLQSGIIKSSACERLTTESRTYVVIQAESCEVGYWRMHSRQIIIQLCAKASLFHQAILFSLPAWPLGAYNPTAACPHAFPLCTSGLSPARDSFLFFLRYLQWFLFSRDEATLYELVGWLVGW